MKTTTTRIASTAMLSTSALILLEIGKMNTFDEMTLGHGGNALTLARAPIDITEFEELKLGLDEREQELTDEDGQYVPQAIDKLNQVRVAVATQAKRFVDTSSELYESLFGNIDTLVDNMAAGPETQSPLGARAAGADHGRTVVHAPAE